MPPPEESEAVRDEAGAPSPELLSKVDELLANVELLDIRPCAIEARLEEGVAPGVPVESVEMEHSASFAVDEGLYSSRYDYRFRLINDTDEGLIGTIQFTLLLDYNVSASFTGDAEAADFVASTTGYFAAYPYARELFESLATRLHFDPIVLGLIRRGSIRPGSISIAPYRMARPAELEDSEQG